MWITYLPLIVKKIWTKIKNNDYKDMKIYIMNKINLL